MSTRRLFAALFTFAGAALAQEVRLIDLLPAHPDTVSGFNVSQVLASPFGQQLLAQMQDDEPRLRQFLEIAGIDARRDLREVVISSYARSGETNRNLLIARGSFDSARLRAQFLKNGPVTEFLGTELLRTSADGGNVAFLENGIAVAGDATSIRDALSRRKSGLVSLPASLTQRIQQISSRYDIWLFTANPASTLANHVDERIVEATTRHTPILRGVQYASGGIKLGPQVTIAAEAVMSSEKDASAAADVLRFVSGLVRMAPDKLPNAEFLGLLESMDVRSQSNALTLSFSIPQGQLLRLFNSSAKTAREAII
jgi:hypothetical protein